MNKFKYLTVNKIDLLPGNSGVYPRTTTRTTCRKRANWRSQSLFGVGVYCLKDKNGKILYIGKANNLRERVKSHFQRPDHKDNLFLERIKKIGYIKTDSEIEALILETNLIKKYQPKFNVMWRDDKNYFFVGITKEGFPRVFITHQPIRQTQGGPKLKTINYKLKTNFVGPFVDGAALKQTLKILRKVFPYRTCRFLPKRPCLWYQLDKCQAPCLLRSKFGSRLPNIPSQIKKECQQNVKNLIKILRGKKVQVLKDLKKEMEKSAKNQQFEKAAKIRNQILALERIFEHRRFLELPRPAAENNRVKTHKILQKLLKTKKEIKRIEAYDVSNIQGQQATGSMVTFINGKPDKNYYRRFKIKIAGKPDDIAMLKEIISRRLAHPEWPYPDLMLIDGGIAQLNAASRTLNQYKSAKSASIRVLSLAKKENKLYIEGREKPILLKTLPRGIFNLILQMRDEAHRFAIIYHKRLRKLALMD